jgi:hypothetical protein
MVDGARPDLSLLQGTPPTDPCNNAWADGRIGWWEVMLWSEDGRFTAIAAAAREAGVTWPSPSADHFPSCPDYEEAFVAWADHQTNLLLRCLAGDPHAGTRLDWANLANEMARVPTSLVREAELHLARALAYVAKIAAEPAHPATRHWRRAAFSHFSDAQIWLDRPDLRACVKLEFVWFQARRIAMFDLGLDAWHPS